MATGGGPCTATSTPPSAPHTFNRARVPPHASPQPPAQLPACLADTADGCADDKEDWSTQLEALKLHKRKHATRSAHGRAPALDPDLWVNLAFHCATTANLECEIGIPSFAEHPDVRPSRSCVPATEYLRLLPAVCAGCWVQAVRVKRLTMTSTDKVPGVPRCISCRMSLRHAVHGRLSMRHRAPCVALRFGTKSCRQQALSALVNMLPAIRTPWLTAHSSHAHAGRGSRGARAVLVHHHRGPAGLLPLRGDGAPRMPAHARFQPRRSAAGALPACRHLTALADTPAVCWTMSGCLAAVTPPSLATSLWSVACRRTAPRGSLRVRSGLRNPTP